MSPCPLWRSLTAVPISFCACLMTNPTATRPSQVRVSANNELLSLLTLDYAVRSPTFEWLSDQGMWFLNAHADSPSCTPSRGAMLTGCVLGRATVPQYRVSPLAFNAGRHSFELGTGAALGALFPGQLVFQKCIHCL